MSRILIWILSIIMYSCAQVSDPINLNVVHKDTIYIYPDSSTNIFSHNIQRHRYKGRDAISITSLVSSEIIVFSLSDGKIIDKVKLESEGPNSVGYNKDELSHSFLSDTALLVFNTARQTIYQLSISKDGYSVINKCTIPVDSTISTAFPVVNTYKPIVPFNGNIILSGLLLGFEPVKLQSGVKNLIEINLNGCKFRSGLPRSSIYDQGNFGVENGYQVYHAYNNDKNIIYYSFGIDNNVYYMSNDYKVRSFFMGDEDINIQPFKEEKVDFYNDEHRMLSYDNMNSFYSYIIYNSYNKCLYRFIRLALTEIEKEAGKVRSSKFKILVYDNNYKEIGYTLIDFKTSFLPMIFPHEDGLAIIEFNQIESEERYPIKIYSFN